MTSTGNAARRGPSSRRWGYLVLRRQQPRDEPARQAHARAPAAGLGCSVTDYQLSTWQDATGCFIPVGSITVRDWPRLSVMP